MKSNMIEKSMCVLMAACVVALVVASQKPASAEVTDAQHAASSCKVDTAGTNPNEVHDTNQVGRVIDPAPRDRHRHEMVRRMPSDKAGVAGSMTRPKRPKHARALTRPAPPKSVGSMTRPTDADKSEDAVPDGLTGSDWTGIRGAYERHRHAAVSVDGEFRARNPGQQWLTHFDGRGFVVEPAIAGVEPDAASWRWGLELKSYGFPGHQRAVNGQAKMTAQGDRVTYDWHGGLREWFVNGRGGLEHGFTLANRPPGAGDARLHTGDTPSRVGDRLADAGRSRVGRVIDPASRDRHRHEMMSRTPSDKAESAGSMTRPTRLPGAGDSQLVAGDNRPAADDWLELRMAVRGGLRAKGHADGRGVSFVNQHGSTVVNYAGLKVWDADHRELLARIDVDAAGLRLTVDERGARYPLTVDPVAQQAYLKASNTGVRDQFADSVAVSHDTVVVGAPFENSIATGVNGNQADNRGLDSGAAYVFVRDGGGAWSQQAYLKASNTEESDRFGDSVAVSGDTVVVGAFFEDSNAAGVNGNQANNFARESGAAYVFVRDGGGVWTQQAYLKASNTGAGDQFAGSVAVSGDTVLVGARREDSNATGVNGGEDDNSAGSSGAAYVFVRDGGGVWSQQAYLKASNTGADDRFGVSVGVSGDTVVVGAVFEDSNATGVNGNQADNSASWAGAAYVFVRDGGGVWSQQAYLKASNTDGDDRFGARVSVSGETVVVGAFSEDSSATGVNGNQADNSATNSGAAYVFVRTGLDWTQQAYFKASNTEVTDKFGVRVGVSGDTVVVGANGEDSNATGVNGNQADNSAVDSGAAYVFVRDGGVWTQRAYIKASNTEGDDRFGRSVDVSGDTVVVGTIWEDSNATGVNGNQSDNSAHLSGAAYVFVISPIVCGDETVEGTEQCDDGDTIDGDGCSATCEAESGFTCLGEPSVCVPSDGQCGDLDGDLDVDGDDLAVLLAAFGRSVGDPRYNAVADFDGDGTVTPTDFERWLTCFRVKTGDAFAPAPQAGLLGDLDADWDLDLADFADFEFCLSDPPGFQFPCVMKFDFDGNDLIDINDYSHFQPSISGPMP